ncbi:DUF1543 domain-containing protein [Flavobacterium sp. NRK F10]|nr:DUF1543 domain-containing protein [Flavobacterium sp. NRK F10]
MISTNLYMIMLGCTPKGRITEQHDIFFGIGTTLQDLIPDMYTFWPEAEQQIHIDAWQKVTQVEDFSIKVIPKAQAKEKTYQLFFINLGGYQPEQFEEFHHKLLIVATSKSEAIKKAKQTHFYQNFSFKGAVSHIDDQYGVAIDEIYDIEEILSDKFKKEYALNIIPGNQPPDEVHIGYLKMNKINF